ncbi:hypothetical protein BaRGS_00002536, partial [Batillaria attramentaria]
AHCTSLTPKGHVRPSLAGRAYCQSIRAVACWPGIDGQASGFVAADPRERGKAHAADKRGLIDPSHFTARREGRRVCVSVLAPYYSSGLWTLPPVCGLPRTGPTHQLSTPQS